MLRTGVSPHEEEKAAAELNEMLHLGSEESLERIENTVFAMSASKAAIESGRSPAAYSFAPQGLQEVRHRVEQAIAVGKTCKARGRGYAFSDAARTDGHALDMAKRHNRILHPDCLQDPINEHRFCRFESGATIDILNAHLKENGRALLIQPGYGDLTFVGTMLAGGHGSGTQPGLGPLSSSVRSLELLVAENNVSTANNLVPGVVLLRVEPVNGITDPQQFRKKYPYARLLQDNDVFQSCCVSMGTLGVVTAVTIETRDKFNIEETRSQTTWELALDRLPHHLDDEKLHSVELWVNPYKHPPGERTCIESLRRETKETVKGERGIGIRLGSATGYRVLAHLLNEYPAKVPLMTSVGLRSTTTNAAVVMDSPTGLDFGAPNLAPVYATGFSIMVDTQDISQLRKITDWIFDWVKTRGAANRWVTSPLGLRFVRAADAFLSPAFGRMSCMLEFCSLQPTHDSKDTVSCLARDILGEFSASEVRPHWGLLNELTTAQYQLAYPVEARRAFAEAVALLDPQGQFEGQIGKRLSLGSFSRATPAKNAQEHPHWSYGGLFGSSEPCPPHAPANTAEIIDALTEAGKKGSSLTVRGGGMSIYTQSLSTGQPYLHTDRLASIQIDTANKLAIVGPGATWGQIYDAARRTGLAPMVCVTTRTATAGGTLSSNGISQASRLFGHEIDTVEWIVVVLPPEAKGSVASLRKLKQPDMKDTSDDAKLFRAIIGGFGLIAVIVEIAYKLIDSDPSQRVVTRVYALELEKLGTELVELERNASTQEDSELRRAVSLFRADNKSWRPYRFDMRVTGAPRGDALVSYEGPTARRRIGELLLSNPLTVRLPHKLSADHCDKYAKKNRVFINELDGYTFFMEPNRLFRHHRSAYEPGDRLPLVQQTYVLPDAKRTAEFIEKVLAFLVDASEAPSDRDVASLAREAYEQGLDKPQREPDWIGRALGPSRAAEATRNDPSTRDADVDTWLQRYGFEPDLVPALFDIIWLPKDSALLSATHGASGYAVTLAFQGTHLKIRDGEDAASTWSSKVSERTISTLRDLSDHAQRLGGRVHLTKSVFLNYPAEYIKRMLGARLTEFLELRKKHDPESILESRFGVELGLLSGSTSEVSTR